MPGTRFFASGTCLAVLASVFQAHAHPVGAHDVGCFPSSDGAGALLAPSLVLGRLGRIPAPSGAPRRLLPLLQTASLPCAGRGRDPSAAACDCAIVDDVCHELGRRSHDEQALARVARLRGGGRKKAESSEDDSEDGVIESKVSKKSKPGTSKKGKAKKEESSGDSEGQEEPATSEAEGDLSEEEGDEEISDEGGSNESAAGDEEDQVSEVQSHHNNSNEPGGSDSNGDLEGGAQGEEGDEMLTCRDCNSEFAFTVGEQEFFRQKGFENKPTRCRDCKVCLISVSAAKTSPPAAANAKCLEAGSTGCREDTSVILVFFPRSVAFLALLLLFCSARLCCAFGRLRQ